MIMINAILSTMAYIEKDGCYLMLHRTKKEKDLNKGKYLGVGGRFEVDESPDECVFREVQEETGLTMTNFKYRGVVTFVSEGYISEYMFIYTCDEFIGDMIECNEGDLYWIPKEKILDLPMWAGDKYFLEKIEKGESSFSMKVSYVGDDLVAVYDGVKRIK